MLFDLPTFYRTGFAERSAVTIATEEALLAPFADLAAAGVASIKSDGKILFFGNGGSATDAQHLAAELTIRYRQSRAAIAAIELTTDTSAITACGNDLAFEQVFARQIETPGRKVDFAIDIFTSGKSANVFAGLRQAKAMGIIAGGDMAAIADHLIALPSKVTARIEEMRIVLGQMLCGALEISLGLVDDPCKSSSSHEASPPDCRA